MKFSEYTYLEYFTSGNALTEWLKKLRVLNLFPGPDY